ncbi:MAG: aspartate aminotransferase family protein [Candidatus Thorarchaeota archaeon]
MPSKDEIIKQSREHCLHGWGYSPIVFVEGKGAIVRDIDGKEYIDALGQTAGVLGIGHSHPKYVKAVQDQVAKISHTLTMFTNPPRAELAKKLSDIAPGKMKGNAMSYFSCGGTEANETALKLAMQITGRREAISVHYSYHGGTLAMMSLLGQSYIIKGYPRFPGFSQIPNAYCYRCVYGKEYPGCDFECARALEQQVKYGATEDGVAAFILEPIQGNGGHQCPPDPEYFKIIRETCDKYGIFFIADEIQTGMGRTGKIWACDYYGVTPDIFTTAKAIGGGMPVSATVINKDHVPKDMPDSQWHIFTFGGGPVLCAAANATIDVMQEEKLADKAAAQGKRMTKRLLEMQEDHKIIGDVRGPGLFIGVELVKDRKTKAPAIDEAGEAFVKALEKGVFFGVSNIGGVGNIIKLKPPLSITDEQADKVLDVLDEVLKEIA